MTKQMKMKVVKNLPNKLLALQIEGIVNCLAEMPTDKEAKADLALCHAELKRRGYTFHNQPDGLHFVRYDALAAGPVKMKVPSPSDLINGKVATDLPRYDYLT